MSTQSQRRKAAAHVLRHARVTAAMPLGPRGVLRCAWLVGWQFTASLHRR